MLLFTSQIYGSCVLDLLKSSSDDIFGKLQAKQHSQGVKYAVNTSWNLPYPDCINYQCSEYELECHEYVIICTFLPFFLILPQIWNRS
jgi:hypothetical protein